MDQHDSTHTCALKACELHSFQGEMLRCAGEEEGREGSNKGKKEKRAGECVRAAKENHFQLQPTSGK